MAGQDQGSCPAAGRAAISDRSNDKLLGYRWRSRPAERKPSGSPPTGSCREAPGADLRGGPSNSPTIAGRSRGTVPWPSHARGPEAPSLPAYGTASENRPAPVPGLLAPTPVGLVPRRRPREDGRRAQRVAPVPSVRVEVGLVRNARRVGPE